MRIPRNMIQPMSVAADGTDVLVFGPYLPGQVVKTVKLMLHPGAAVTPPGVGHIFGLAALQDEVASEAQFLANGRPLIRARGATPFTIPSITNGGGSLVLDVPVEFVATETERYLGVLFTDGDSQSWAGLVVAVEEVRESGPAGDE